MYKKAKRLRMKHTIKSIATIQSGHTFRSKIANDPQGNARVLRISELRVYPHVEAAELPLVQWDMAKTSALIKPTDVIMPARGQYYGAKLVQLHEPVLASNQLHILRIQDNAVLPEYLCWALNQDGVQQSIAGSLRGTGIPQLNKKNLGEVQVTVPSLETQKKIIVLQAVWEQEQQLTQQLLDNRETMLKGMFQHLLNDQSRQA